MEQYTSHYNLRLYYLHEPDGETSSQCEDTVLQLFHDKLQLRHIKKQDLDAEHRLGRKTEGTRPTRGEIVRFVSRRVRDEVTSNRRKLKQKKKGKSVVIVEDLRKRNNHPYSVARDNPMTRSCWTKNGKIFIKAVSGRLAEIKSTDDLQDPGYRISPPCRPKVRPQ